MHINTSRRILMVFLILGVALFTRLYLLPIIPTGLSDDEILFPLSGRSFFYSGKDLTEQWSPFSLRKPPANIIQVFGKVPYILFSPHFSVTKFSSFTARLPYALFGSLFTLVMFLIGKKLFSTKIAYVIALLYAVNPWSVFFSRTSYEAPIGVYFAFSLFALLLYTKSWRIFLAFPLYVLSLYSYIATPIVLPLFSGIVILYSWLVNRKKYTGQYLCLFFLLLAAEIFYIVRLPYDVGGTRTGQLMSPYSESIASSVDLERKLTIPSQVTGIFINKYGNFFRRFIVQYAKAFSPSYLFVQGEEQARFSLDSHGLFYLVDMVFFVIGSVSLLFHKNRARTVMLLALLLVAPIPSAISEGETQYVIRSAFLFPTVLIFVGYGIYATIHERKNKKFAAMAITAAYVISFANFGYLYIFKNPIANYDAFGLSGRIVARYLSLSKEHNRKVQILFRGTNKGLLKQYLFFANRYTRDNHSDIAKLYTQDIVHIDTTTFADCQDRSEDGVVTTIIPFNFVCMQKKPLNEILNITNYVSNQPVYVIYNDTLCKNYPVSPYLHALTFRDFNIETMKEQEFCQKFFTRDSGFVSPDGN